jgi:hypothetical protein
MSVRLTSDPVLSPGVIATAARRDEAGAVFLWVPGEGNVAEFAKFVGDEFVPVGDKLYTKHLGDSLIPVDVSESIVALKPHCGDVQFMSPAEFMSQFVLLEVEQWQLSTEPRRQADNAEFALVDDRLTDYEPVVSPDAAEAVPVKRGPGRPKKVSA